MPRLATLAAGRLDATPSTVTTRSSPDDETAIVCAALEPERSIAHAAGGDGPLPGFAAGSGGGGVVPAGALPSSPVAAVPSALPPPAPDCASDVPELPEPVGAVPATGVEPSSEVADPSEGDAEMSPDVEGATDGCGVDTAPSDESSPPDGGVTSSVGDGGGAEGCDRSSRGGAGAEPPMPGAADAAETSPVSEDEIVPVSSVTLWSERAGFAGAAGTGGAAAGGAAVVVVVVTSTGVPASSTTSGALSSAEEDCADGVAAAGAPSVYVSVTTGMRCGFAGAWTAGVAETGATTGAECSFGTFSRANDS